jgi:drug/metabolite transporter (DMT)-like permease
VTDAGPARAVEPDPAARRLAGALGIAAAACLWGTWSLFFRPAERLAPLGAPFEAFVVFSVILLATGPLAFRDRVRRRRPLAGWLGLALVGVFDALNAVFFFWAMQRTTLAVAVLTHYLAPVLVALAAPLVVAERVNRGIWAVLALALAGLVLLVQPWRAPDLGSLAGAGLGAASAVFFTGSLLGAKRLGASFAPTEILAWHMPTALCTLALFLPHGVWHTPANALFWVVAAGLGPGAAAGVLFIRGLAWVEASRASILMLLEPVVAVLIGIVVWHEAFGPLAFAGAAMVLTAAYLVVSSKAT